MVDAFHVEILGLKELQDKTEQMVRDLRGDEFLQGMRDVTLMLQRDAKINVPVDTGRLRASITPTVEMNGDTVEGIVGTNITYAPYVEFGTAPHRPPIAALEVWARRHGMSAYVLANIIAQRGTKASHFFQRAFDDNESKIKDLLGDVVGKIVSK